MYEQDIEPSTLLPSYRQASDTRFRVRIVGYMVTVHVSEVQMGKIRYSGKRLHSKEYIDDNDGYKYTQIVTSYHHNTILIERTQIVDDIYQSIDEEANL